MRAIYKVIFIAFIIVSLSSCYAMSDDGVLSSTDDNVVVSNGYPYYNRDRRIVYYYYNRDYYYPYYYKGHRCFKKYYRPLPPPRRHRPPQPRFNRVPPRAPNHGSFGNMHRRPQMNNNVGKFGHRR